MVITAPLLRESLCARVLTVSLFVQSFARLMLLFHHVSLLQVGVNSIKLYKLRYYSMNVSCLS